MTKTRSFIGGLAVLSLLTATVATAADQAEPSLSITLSPMMKEGSIVGLAVEQAIEGVRADASTPLFQMPLVTHNVPTVASSLQALTARDAQGPVALTSRDEGDGPAKVRRWFPDRAVTGTVHARYETTQANVLAPLGAAPPIEMRIEGGAMSGGAAILALRPVVPSVSLSIRWDLSESPGDLGVDSLAGQTKSNVPPSMLDQVFLMAGQLGRHPAERNALGFQAVWQDEPPFDAASLMQWTERLHADYVRFFQANPEPYTVFLRRNLVNAGGGIGMSRSFVTTFGNRGQGDDPQDLKFTLAHEMFHTFQPRLSGQEGLAGSWFNEGMAVFYQRVLPFRSGLIDAEAFLEDLNFHAARYYTNALGNAPNSEVSARFWEDTRIRTLPYDRGFLYFATVDEAVRNKSNGKRSLDHLMLQMKAREKANQPVTVEAWEAALRDELGEAGVKSFRAMLAGSAPLPGSDAFGPCFKRISKQMRRYELGFAPKALTESPRKVRGLIAGSAAERAGLRNGDEITQPVPQDDIQGRQDRLLKLQINRDGKPLTVEYLPRSESVATWQWERVPDVPAAQCAR
ncbi:MAG TPA: hypothetical protein VGD45_21785 [Steroidobacter sp.]|uniref:M61 family metallopeptidase n=1 Tax=Steroidobacter sp. TaxID=1978227 RepID=UPI002EDB8407